MLDRQKVEAILRRRFSGATDQQVAAAANAIMGLDEEWEEVLDQERAFGHLPLNEHRDTCYLGQELDQPTEFRVLRRRHA